MNCCLHLEHVRNGVPLTARKRLVRCFFSMIGKAKKASGFFGVNRVQVLLYKKGACAVF